MAYEKTITTDLLQEGGVMDRPPIERIRGYCTPGLGMEYEIITICDYAIEQEARVRKLERALMQALECIKLIHPYHDKEEPCIAFEAIEVIQQVLKE
jgi:hypothetical protein